MLLLITHVSVALLSLIQATYALVAPSKTKLRTVYGLAAATLATGTCLVMQSHSSLVSSCFSGLVYLAVVSALSATARYRLTRITAKS